MAATLAQAPSTSRPDAVAGLSPFARFTLMSDPHHTNVWGCDEPEQTQDDTNCAIGKQNPQNPDYWEGGLNRYLQCSRLLPPPRYYDDTCVASYKAAGPWDVVDVNGIFPPSTYQVNGGGPDSGQSPPELASLEAAIEFNNKLIGHPAHRLCTVNSTQHGTHLLPLTCNDDATHTVQWNLVDWLGNNGICDVDHPCSF